MTDFGVETVELDLPPLVASFGRRLHDRGVPVTPGRSADFARALTLVRPIARHRLYWTARACFVTDPAQVPAFDEVFFTVFGSRLDQPEAEPDEARPLDSDASRRPRTGDAEERGRGGADQGGGEGEEETGSDLPLLLASDEEVLRRKRFDELEPHELAHLYRLMSSLRLAPPERRTRRYRRGRQGEHVDLRRTLRTSLRTGGDPIRLARRHRRVARRRLVVLCDISGSMEPYARAYLQFLTAAGTGARAEAFVFATRLTRVTRALAARNPERALRRAAEAAPDWSSGTRIGAALREFNDRHGRRGLARGAVVVILSDGWELGDPRLVEREMARLSRLAHRIVWVNPRVAADAFAVRSGGMVAALPYCDALVSGHSFAALDEVVTAIAGGGAGEQAEAAPEEPEPWASATPVPGSSVAMPTGHGPSRGKTSPGWVTDE
jgi:uncharacterized protein with von Willebrand factor type A (vWA) domain